MKTLKIKSIELLNFMKFGSFKTDFADFTKISGMNAESQQLSYGFYLIAIMICTTIRQSEEPRAENQ